LLFADVVGDAEGVKVPVVVGVGDVEPLMKLAPS
jgi:hypothetical protein